MPALGLLLEYPIFESYNRKTETINEKLQSTDVEYRPAIDFEVHRREIDQFKQEFIYSKMRQTEDRDGVFVVLFDNYSYFFFLIQFIN